MQRTIIFAISIGGLRLEILCATWRFGVAILDSCFISVCILLLSAEAEAGWFLFGGILF